MLARGQAHGRGARPLELAPIAGVGQVLQRHRLAAVDHQHRAPAHGRRPPNPVGRAVVHPEPVLPVRRHLDLVLHPVARVVDAAHGQAEGARVPVGVEEPFLVQIGTIDVRTPGADLPMAIGKQRAEVPLAGFHVRQQRHHDLVAVRLPAGDCLAAAEHGLLAGERLVTDGTLLGAGVFRPKRERLGQIIGPATDLHADRPLAAALCSFQPPDRVARGGQRGERPVGLRVVGRRQRAGPGVVARGGDVERLFGQGALGEQQYGSDGKAPLQAKASSESGSHRGGSCRAGGTRSANWSLRLQGGRDSTSFLT